MRPAALAAVLLSLCGCGAHVTPIIGPPPQPPVQAFVIPAEATFILTVSEAVGNPDEDLPSFVKVFVDGREAGRTATEPKSKERRWGEAVAPGNHLFRFEVWVQPTVGEPAPVRADWQPPERFIRVEPGQRTLVSLKFVDGGRRHALQTQREPLQ